LAALGIAVGVLMTAVFILHPAVEHDIFGADPVWIPAHPLLWLSFVEIGPPHPSLFATLGDRDIVSAAERPGRRF